MADATETKAAESKMDQAIAEVSKQAEVPVTAPVTAPVAAPVANVTAPVAKAPVVKTAAAKAPAAKAAPAKPPVPAASPIVNAPVNKAAAAPKAKSATAKKTALKKAVVKQAAPKKPAVTKRVKPTAKSAVKPTTVSQIKDTIMTKTQTAAEDFTAKIKDTFTEAQDRAKVAYEKGTALFSEAGEFTKGNVEAIVESSKLLAAGLQGMGKDYVAETKSAFETMTADVKELAAIKSPADFFKLQGEILRRNFDAVVASGSKHSEAVVKLTNESLAPISNRVSIAIEKVKKAA